MKTRTVLLALLFVLCGLSQAVAAPPSVAHATRSALAKARDRDAKGRFLPNVKEADVKQRAYFKYEARLASGTPGSAEGDYLAAKGELQRERSAELAAEKAAAHRAKIRALGLRLGQAWGARVTIGGQVADSAAK